MGVCYGYERPATGKETKDRDAKNKSKHSADWEKRQLEKMERQGCAGTVQHKAEREGQKYFVQVQLQAEPANQQQIVKKNVGFLENLQANAELQRGVFGKLKNSLPGCKHKPAFIKRFNGVQKCVSSKYRTACIQNSAVFGKGIWVILSHN